LPGEAKAPTSDGEDLRSVDHANDLEREPERIRRTFAQPTGWSRPGRSTCGPKTPPMMTSSDNGITMRTIVDLPDRERDQLDALCRQRGLSRAEAIRQALRLWLQQQSPAHGEVFGLWRDRSEGSLEWQDALRQEWSEP
jgi:hypothetical protein